MLVHRRYDERISRQNRHGILKSELNQALFAGMQAVPFHHHQEGRDTGGPDVKLDSLPVQEWSPGTRDERQLRIKKTGGAKNSRSGQHVSESQVLKRDTLKIETDPLSGPGLLNSLMVDLDEPHPHFLPRRKQLNTFIPPDTS
jgi:hypothetical protein